MKLIAVYVTIVVVGILIAYVIGLVVERWSTSSVSLIVFLGLFFSVFIVGWRLAIRLT